MNSKLLFAVLGISISLSFGKIFSQSVIPCGTDEMLKKSIAEHPELVEQMLQYQKDIADFVQKQKAGKVAVAPPYIIPVVVHVIHNYGSENISDAQILDAISILNRDYNMQNQDTAQVQDVFKPLIANCRFEFKLASKDPQGKCTNGIDRIQSMQTYIGGDAAKLNPWPKEKYLNIWTVSAIRPEASGFQPAGYATFPSSSAGFYGPLDGVMLLSHYIGSIGSSSISNSRTLTHEVGHWLSLYHTWGANNSPEVTCGDDFISDTPVTKGHNPGHCTKNDTTCTPVGKAGIIENVENYMEYSYCCKMFTLGQKAAMEAALNSSVAGRNNLWTSTNLAFTGVDGSGSAVCVPKADFYSFGNYLCTGVNVLFYDVSWKGAVTSRTWTFSNGTPATDTARNPVVVFNSPGWQSVSLTVTNSAGNDTKTVTKQVFISDGNVSQHTGNLVEGFENQSEFDSDWLVNNYPVDINNTSSWKITNTASSSGTSSIMLNAFATYSSNAPFASNVGDVDEFITPSVDLTGVSPAYLSFRAAYATSAFKASNITESLKIYFSNNCGKNWTLDTTFSGASFANAGSTGNAFVPTKPTWCTRKVLLSPVVAKANMRFKFAYTTSAYSNNLYIDDINIGTTPISVIGINESENALNSLSVFPNPASDAALIAYHIGQKQTVDLSLYDILGNKVITLVNQAQGEGDYSYEVNKQNISKGMYFIRLSVGDKNSSVKKFILLD